MAVQELSSILSCLSDDCFWRLMAAVFARDSIVHLSPYTSVISTLPSSQVVICTAQMPLSALNSALLLPGVLLVREARPLAIGQYGLRFAMKCAGARGGAH